MHDAEDYKTTVTYNEAGRVEWTRRFVDATRYQQTTTVYDDRGRPHIVTDPAGEATYLEYNDFGALAKVWAPTESPTGNPTQVPFVDPNGVTGRAVTSSKYDGQGLLWRRSGTYQHPGTAGNGYIAPDWDQVMSYQQFSYDDAGRVTKTSQKSLTSISKPWECAESALTTTWRWVRTSWPRTCRSSQSK